MIDGHGPAYKEIGRRRGEGGNFVEQKKAVSGGVKPIPVVRKEGRTEGNRMERGKRRYKVV